MTSRLTPMRLRRARLSAGLVVVSALGGCGAGSSSNNSIFDQLAASPTVPAPTSPSGYVPINLPPEMIGKWVLAAPGIGYCTLAFSGAPGASEGSIATEGACPGQFSSSRRWVLDKTNLAIRDAAGGTLVRLSVGDATRFDGLNAQNEMITLTR